MSERLVEIPQLLRFVDSHPDIKTVLDVGSFGSTYIEELEARGLTVTRIDVLPSPGIIAGNVKTYQGSFDLVICLSSLEHSGLEQYQVDDWEAEQTEVFGAMFRLAKKYLWISVPYGAPDVHEGHFANMTPARLSFLLKMVSKSRHDIYRNETPPTPDWNLVSDDEAANYPYERSIGVRQVLILEVYK